MEPAEYEAENARLREELRALQARYDHLDATATLKIQRLTDENEILAEANRILMENAETFKRLGAPGDDGAASASTSFMQIPDELLLPGLGVTVSEVAALDSVHSFGNLLCVTAMPTRPEIVVSGGVDKHICVHDYQRSVKLASLSVSAPVLSVSFNPNPAFGTEFLATQMDAKHALYRLVAGADDKWQIEEIAMFHDHTRPGAMKAAWNRSGDLFATASSDKSVNMYQCAHLDSTKPHCEKLRSYYFNGTVEAIAFTPAQVDVKRDEEPVAAQAELLVCAVRDDCYVHYVDCSTFEKERVNMNQDGIEHVSYTIMDLRVSPSGKYLLAATDTNRHFIFETKSNVVLRNFYGHKAGPYSQPRVVWHPSEKYVVSNTEDSGMLYIWCIASERVVETVAAHDALVRDLAFASTTESLVTVSYDKRLKVWSCASASPLASRLALA